MNTIKSIYFPALLILVLTSQVSFAQFADQSETEKVQQHEISHADLRLNQAYPGPRSVLFQNEDADRSLLGTLGSKPGYAFLSSLLIPGLGQAANDNWIRAGVYAAVEITAVSLFFINEHQGRKGEQRYMDYAHEKFSTIKYAQWMVQYNEHNGRTVPYEDVTADNIDLMSLDYTNYTYSEEWDLLDLNALNELESSTIYYDAGNVGFSHYLDGFGSQQYYELVSKYFQYGPGWLDWEQNRQEPFLLLTNVNHMSPYWREHAQIGADFNNDLSLARNMIILIFANHFISAMDALLSNKLQSHRIETSANYNHNGPSFSVGYRF